MPSRDLADVTLVSEDDDSPDDHSDCDEDEDVQDDEEIHFEKYILRNTF